MSTQIDATRTHDDTRKNAGRPRACVVVDGYSAAVPLAGMITRAGYDVVHVQSSDTIFFGARTFRPGDYVANVIFDGDLPKLLAALAPYDVAAVIAGVQTGVVLADRLGEALGAPSNGTAQSLDRIDKFAMFRVLDAHGLLCARSVASADVDELLAWARERRITKTVVKPPTSAGTDHVTVCRSEQEIRAAFAGVFHQQNKMGLTNEVVVLQELLEGTEYIVNTVSFKGVHRMTDCWRYRKVATNGGSFVYEKCEILDASAEPVAALRDYTFRVLDAFGVKEGPSHNEVMMTAAGPALIEINPRIAGARIPTMAALAIGRGQLEWTVTALLERDATPAGFEAPYTLKRHAMLCPLISHVQGTFAGLRFQREVEALPSFQFADYFVEVGDTIKRTIDCYTQPGIVFLAHPDPSVLERDYRTIRELEAQGLYRVVA